MDDQPACQGCQQRDRRIAAQQARIAALEAQVAELTRQVEALTRAGKRQAAPFSKGKPKQEPKQPGRKSGAEHGKHGHREPPPADQVDETHDAPLPDQCACGGRVVEDRVDEQFQTEIPQKPIFRKFNVHCGHCDRCGKTIRGRHPLQTSDATGAARSQLGSVAQAAVVYLNKHAGMSHGKIADTFDKLFGIPITRGACAQIVLRAGRKLQPAYAEIKEHIKSSEHLTPDETGWRIGGHGAWLHSCVGDDGATLYIVDAKRSAQVLENVIGADWDGILTHDGYASYNRFTEATHQQCVDHALRRARRLLEKQSGPARTFPQRVITLFTLALRLRDRFNERQADGPRRERAYHGFVRRLRELTHRPRHNLENERFAAHLHRHASSWFVFLLDPKTPATNYLGEHALRGPIANRKVCGGNRTEAGADAQETNCSVLQTCKNRAVNALRYVSDALRGIVRTLFG